MTGARELRGIGTSTAGARTGDRTSVGLAGAGLAFAALGVALTLGGCTVGGGGGESGSSFTPLSEGSTAAMLRAPAWQGIGEFVLHGTFPVPRGTFPRPDGLEPFAVRDLDGNLVPTQAEIVSRYANAADGAEVVEVVARVHSGGAAAGQALDYPIVLAPHAGRPDPGAPGPEDLRDGPVGVPSSVRNLVSAGGNGIAIIATDCFGNLYRAAPLDGSGSMKLLRHGANQATLRVAQNLFPTPPVPGSTLPHLLGTQAYVSTFAGEERIELDLRLHHGHSGNDSTTDQDDPLGPKVYFRDVSLVVPNGWSVQQQYQDPGFGAPYQAGDYKIYPFVRPNDDGTMHVLRWQGQFHRRFAISTDGAQGEARAALDGLGLGFCRRGADPVEGYEYYSWWNEDTARYFPQSFQLPSLAHIGQTTVFNAVNGQLNQTRGHLLAGTSTGAYPYLVGRMGWGHPWGVAYGGMTGGAEIHIVDGVETAELGAVQGWQLLRAVHRMQTDRMPSTLYDLDGEPSSVEDWLRNAGSPTAYVPFLHFMLPTLESDDPFGVNEAPRFQIDYVAAMGLVPSYEGLHFQFDPHDLQHLVRYTRTAKALVWLANDQLASDDLRMQAENFHFSYHRWYNASGGYAQSTGLRWDRDFVDTHPGKAFEFGRGEAWGLDCMNAAYATSDPAWRTRKRPWFDDVLQLLADGQAACTGFLQAEVITQFLNGNYRARQGIEQPITENAILGMLEAVYRGEDAGRAALGRDVLRDSTLALISPNAWSNGQSAPWTHSAIGPTNPSLQIFCNASQIPPDGFSTAHENFQLWPSLAYGYEETGNGTFLSKGAMASGGGASLLNNLESGGLNNMPNKAPLLALAQRLNGQL